MFGHDPQAAEVPPDAEVEFIDTAEDCAYDGDGCHPGDTCGHLEFVAKVEAATGLRLRSYHGCTCANSFAFAR